MRRVWSCGKREQRSPSKYSWICFSHMKMVKLYWWLIALQTKNHRLSACLHDGSAAQNQGKRGSPEPRVYTVCFLYARDTAVRDQSNINTEQWTMDGGGFATTTQFLEHLCWCHPRTTRQDKGFVKLFYIDTQWRQTITSDSFLRLHLNELWPFRVNYSN